jgi:hypothetical protein
MKPTTDPAKYVQKIQALLAKAEASHFPGEAKLFTAKAQQLMTKWRIDAAMLDAKTSQIEPIIAHDVWIKANAYYAPKAELLRKVAKANNCENIHGRSCFGDLQKMTLVGFKNDCDFVERLFMSLITQANTALIQPDTQAQITQECRRPGEGVRWRNAFMRSYADEIGNRLANAKERAKVKAQSRYGAKSMAIVLAGRAALVSRKYDELFPERIRGRVSTAGRAYGTRAFELGRMAARKADIGRPENRLGRQRQLTQT